jgi:hypothetical protein
VVLSQGNVQVKKGVGRRTELLSQLCQMSLVSELIELIEFVELIEFAK